MQSLSEGLVKPVPQHVLKQDSRVIYPILKQAIDTSSLENHELLGAGARHLQ